MKIIDKNKDFYDFYQNIYKDDHFVFDRHDSYYLSKEEFLHSFHHNAWKKSERYILLQVSHNFWLMRVHLIMSEKTNFPYIDNPIDYTITLLDQWYNEKSELKLIELSEIASKVHPPFGKRQDHLDTWMLDRVKANDYIVEQGFNNFRILRGSAFQSKLQYEDRHIPILQGIGIASIIPPLDIYNALESYFSEVALSQERTESVGLTDKDRISNHGFDIKASFRGK